MNSAFRVIWLVPQSRDIKYYSPPGGFWVKKMSHETYFIRKWSNFLGIAIKLVLYILKQLFASVSVTSGGYLPRRSSSVNIHRYSPPLLWIIVNYRSAYPNILWWCVCLVSSRTSFWGGNLLTKIWKCVPTTQRNRETDAAFLHVLFEICWDQVACFFAYSVRIACMILCTAP